MSGAMRPRRRPLAVATGRIELVHGAGGLATHQLVEELFRPAFAPTLSTLFGAHDVERAVSDDGVVLPPWCVPAGHRLVQSTDGHVVAPLFFPGGDIGALGVHGTVNDLAMMGAEPLTLTIAFILEEGLPLLDLQRIAQSIGSAAIEAGVAVVAGDTKVVERGKADGCFLAVSGLGHVAPEVRLSAGRARPGDVVIVTGTMGDHGVAVLSRRQGLELDTPTTSDTACLLPLLRPLWALGDELRVLRDPTRGGLATTLNEIAAASGVGVDVDEAAIPVAPAVAGACELLGLDPLYLANEGKAVVVCGPGVADAALSLLRAHPLGGDAAVVGHVVADDSHTVALRTPLGGARVLDWLMGDPLPRIC
jgi:hydrogenase expression/formation protein HypE